MIAVVKAGGGQSPTVLKKNEKSEKNFPFLS
jgi:hypothetical protein